MAALGRVALVPAVVASFLLVLIPVLAVVVLGAPSLGLTLADPYVVAAAWRGEHGAVFGAAVGWSAGLLAALGIWGAGLAWRRVVLTAGWVALLAPRALSVPGFLLVGQGHDLAGQVAAFIAQAAPCAGLVLLIMTSALNRLDPRILRSAAASGASPLQAWLHAVLPALAWPLALAGAAGFAFCLCQSRLDALLSHPTLGGLVGLAIGRHDVAAAPDALLLGGMALAPLLPLALLALVVRRVG